MPPSATATEIPIVALPVSRALVPPATEFRSTWLNSSLTALRERGHFERYLTLLPPRYHAPILESVAGVWLPMDVGVGHYRACDALGLSKREAWEIGVDVTRKVHGTSLALAIRLAKQTGVTPWSILGQFPRMWDKVWRGGAVGVYQRGPKDATLEVVQWRLSAIPYVRNTMPAVVQGLVGLFCQKAYVAEIPGKTSDTSLGFRLQWV